MNTYKVFYPYELEESPTGVRILPCPNCGINSQGGFCSTSCRYDYYNRINQPGSIGVSNDVSNDVSNIDRSTKTLPCSTN